MENFKNLVEVPQRREKSSRSLLLTYYKIQGHYYEVYKNYLVRKQLNHLSSLRDKFTFDSIIYLTDVFENPVPS